MDIPAFVAWRPHAQNIYGPLYGKGPFRVIRKVADDDEGKTGNPLVLVETEQGAVEFSIYWFVPSP